MNWEAIGAVSQAVSALALILVLIQVRHAREEARRSARQARLDAAREYWLALATHSELAGAYETLSSGTGNRPTSFAAQAVTMGITQTSARQLDAFLWAGWQNFEASIESHQHLSAGVMKGVDTRISYNYGGPFSKWYEGTKEMLNPDAVRYVDALLAGSR